MRAISFLSLIFLSMAGSTQAYVIEASSHLNYEFAPWRAADGKNDTRWASKDMTKDKPEWLRFDFLQSTTVTNITIKWETACALEYKIQMSDDNTTWNTLAHITDGKEESRILNNLNGSGRYLRILCLKNTNYKRLSIWEIEFDAKASSALRAALAKEAEARKKKEEADRIYVQDQLNTFGVNDIIFSIRSDGQDGHWYANFSYWSFNENNMLYRDGGGLCKLNVKTGKMVYLIKTDKGTIRDPAVHYDAKKILFSWRKDDSRVFHLYECDMDGQNIKQITDGEFDDLEPCYLPDGGIMYVSARAKRWVNCWLTQVAVLYRCDTDPSAEDLRTNGGRNVRQISANIEQDNTPWVLPDGRIIYQRWEYVDRSQVHYHHLWTTNPDGTGQMVYFGNQHAGEVYIDAKPIPGTEKVLFVNIPGHGRKEHTGRIAIVSDRNGPDDRSSLKNITPNSDYRDPWPLSEKLYIVSDANQILLMNSEGAVAPIYSLPEELKHLAIQEPRPLITRQRERVIPSRVDLKQETGKLILTDAYYGRNIEGIKPGEIKKLLVLESLPKPVNFTGGMDPLTYGGSFTLERIVGTIPVEEDGSAYMELPANRAFFFVALDENNNSIKRMQSFLSVAPGEVTSCVGCHEERGKTPVNRSQMGTLMALKKPVNKPQPIKGIPEVIDFPRDIQPILDKHCLKCHDYDKRDGGVILTGDRGPMFSHSYVTLTVRRQVADGRNQPKSNYPPRALGTSASPLMNKINGSHFNVKISQHEQDMIRYWIESAACYPGTYASLGNGSIGGYQQNKSENQDYGWLTAKLFSDTVKTRCVSCHKDIPRSLSDESGMSFWQIKQDDPRHMTTRHLVFNLTRPEKSLFLLAPLAKEQGGLALCKSRNTGEEKEEEEEGRGQKSEDSTDKTNPNNYQLSTNNQSEVVFNSKTDEDYLALLAHIQAGKDYLENDLTRFDMPNFKPRRDYLREMKRYGILPADFDIDNPTNVDVYDLDRKYWESMWYKAK